MENSQKLEFLVQYSLPNFATICELCKYLVLFAIKVIYSWDVQIVWEDVGVCFIVIKHFMCVHILKMASLRILNWDMNAYVKIISTIVEQKYSYKWKNVCVWVFVYHIVLEMRFKCNQTLYKVIFVRDNKYVQNECDVNLDNHFWVQRVSYIQRGFVFF